MRSSRTNKVIVTGLALAMLLSGSALYTANNNVFADNSDQAAKQQQAPREAKQDRSEKGKDFKHSDQHRMPILEEAAAILGMDKAALTEAWKQKTLVEIAKEKGIREADLIAKLKAERIKKIDAAVKDGKLPAEKADKIKAGMEKHLAFMVNHKGGFDGHHKMKHRMLPAPDKLASILGISEDQLKAQLKEGKSLADIAAAQGMSKDQLVGKIKEELTPWIEKMVEHKRDPSSAKHKEAK
ncbi:hypothetical protein ACFQ88_13675 [Paenibacillus sp. NPDC056579]|uniref:hypothetical protein n=1 Tax=Paenibacillus sp. NPDC056579 TaxID=3345871 RepID=UPI0036B3F1DE